MRFSVCIWGQRCSANSSMSMRGFGVSLWTFGYARDYKSRMHIDRERTPVAKDVIGNFPFNTWRVSVYLIYAVQVCAWVYICVCICRSVCMYACMHVCMDAWMHGWMDEWMNGCMHGMHACMHVCIHAWVDGWLYMLHDFTWLYMSINMNPYFSNTDLLEVPAIWSFQPARSRRAASLDAAAVVPSKSCRNFLKKKTS